MFFYPEKDLMVLWTSCNWMKKFLLSKKSKLNATQRWNFPRASTTCRRQKYLLEKKPTCIVSEGCKIASSSKLQSKSKSYKIASRSQLQSRTWSPFFRAPQVSESRFKIRLPWSQYVQDSTFGWSGAQTCIAHSFPDKGGEPTKKMGKVSPEEEPFTESLQWELICSCRWLAGETFRAREAPPHCATSSCIRASLHSLSQNCSSYLSTLAFKQHWWEPSFLTFLLFIHIRIWSP